MIDARGDAMRLYGEGLETQFLGSGQMVQSDDHDIELSVEQPAQQCLAEVKIDVHRNAWEFFLDRGDGRRD